MTDPDIEAAAAGILVMMENNIPPDIQELLVRGSKARGVPPGVLTKVIRATFESYRRSAMLANHGGADGRD